MRTSFLVCYLLYFLHAMAQCPSVDIQVPITVCNGEFLDIQNNGSESLVYTWSTCPPLTAGTLGIFQQASNNTGFTASYSFHTSLDFPDMALMVRNAGLIYRISFSSEYSLVNSVSQYLDERSNLSLPREIRFAESDGIPIALVANSGTQPIKRVSFSNGISQNPTYESIPGLEGTTAMFGMDLIEFNEEYIAVAGKASTGDIILMNFGASLASSPNVTSSVLSGVSGVQGISLIDYCGNLAALLTSENSNKLSLLIWENGLTNAPVQSDIMVSEANWALPGKVQLRMDNGEYFGFVQSNSGNTFRLDFGNSLNTSPISNDLGKPAINGYGLEVVKYSVGVRTLVIDYVNANRGLFVASGESSCQFESVIGFEPKINFTDEGNHVLRVKTVENGYQSSKSFPVIVMPDIAPSISFSTVNVCAIFPNTFTPSLSGLTYSWDFNNDGIEDSNLESPSYQFPSSGTYTIRLDVDDGTCGNFTEQTITLYEEPPAPSFTFSGDLCTNAELTFTNDTPDGSYDGPLAYDWDFNGEATASTKDATFTFASSGTKTVTLKSSIPGCENTTQQVINLVPGPTSLFSANPICQDDLMTFTNQSTEADSYLWDFGDGSTSTQETASHLYASYGNFIVVLEATDLGGCTAQYQQEVSVSPRPLADFDFDIPCSGSQGIAFFDQSTVDGADILSWEWTVDGEVMTTDQNPIISFDESGSRVIELKVLSSNGCEATYQETVDILATPQPSFSMDIACQNLETSFLDTTPAQGVISRLWNINGDNYTTPEVDHLFSQAGSFIVSLTVTSDDFCSSTTRSTIEIPQAPILSFSLSSLCTGDDITLDDTSIEGADPVVSRTWLLEGEVFFNGPQALLSDMSPSMYEITLQSTTQAGCLYSTNQIVDLVSSPEANFETSVNYGVPPFEVDFTNNSTGATSYSWLVNGSEVSTAASLAQTFSEVGNHTVELVTTNDDGCLDSEQITILSAVPAINLQIDDLTLTPNGSTQSISLIVVNNGNLPIEIFDVVISAGTDFSISERINQFLNIGAQTSVQLTSSIQSVNASNICVSLVSAYEDVTPDDNEQCVSFSPTVIFENPYPNPISDEATIRLILPKNSRVDLSITSVTGQSMISESYDDLTEGLNVFRFDTSQFKKGIYFVTIQYKGKLVTKRILKF
ncbi:MAG: PKD domain-containing protein [Cytophagales bacterium]|nr:PKD domain-containing protein [Cytophagales bacterium]